MGDSGADTDVNATLELSCIYVKCLISVYTSGLTEL
jgi:hypothetical protein